MRDALGRILMLESKCKRANGWQYFNTQHDFKAPKNDTVLSNSYEGAKQKFLRELFRVHCEYIRRWINTVILQQLPNTNDIVIEYGEDNFVTLLDVSSSCSGVYKRYRLVSHMRIRNLIDGTLLWNIPRIRTSNAFIVMEWKTCKLESLTSVMKLVT